MSVQSSRSLAIRGHKRERDKLKPSSPRENPQASCVRRSCGPRARIPTPRGARILPHGALWRRKAGAAQSPAAAGASRCSRREASALPETPSHRTSSHPRPRPALAGHRGEGRQVPGRWAANLRQSRSFPSSLGSRSQVCSPGASGWRARENVASACCRLRTPKARARPSRG